MGGQQHCGSNSFRRLVVLVLSDVEASYVMDKDANSFWIKANLKVRESRAVRHRCMFST